MSVPASGRVSRRRSARHGPFVRTALGTAALLLATLIPGVHAPAPTVRAASRDAVSILASDPTTLDPAAQGDVESAALTSQLFESLTAFDPGLTLRPALAASWDIGEGGRHLALRLSLL